MESLLKRYQKVKLVFIIQIKWVSAVSKHFLPSQCHSKLVVIIKNGRNDVNDKQNKRSYKNHADEIDLAHLSLLGKRLSKNDLRLGAQSHNHFGETQKWLHKDVLGLKTSLLSLSHFGETRLGSSMVGAIYYF